MHCFSNKFSKSPSAGGSPPPRPLIFNIGDLKLGDLTKLWFFKLIVTKSNLKKVSYDVIFVTSSSLRQPNDVTKINVIIFFHVNKVIQRDTIQFTISRLSVVSGLRVTRTASTQSRQNNGCKE